MFDSSSKSFNGDNLDILYKYLTGNASASYDNVASQASSTTTAANIRSKTLSAGSGYSAKSSSQDVIVTLGGLKWEVVYLSNDTDGEPVLTLWLSNSTQDAFSGRSATEGKYYGYLNGGLYSDWSGNWSATEILTYPSNMYGTSYIRAVTLNNGGMYTYGNDMTIRPITATASQSTSSVFAPFTMDEFGLTEYMVKPTNIPWQQDQSAITTIEKVYTYPNEAISPSTTNWSSTTYDYSGKTNYTAWANDYLWLPSLTETGYSDTYLGMWGVSVHQRQNYNGSTTSSLGSVGSTAGDAYAYSWLRSGYFRNSASACALSTSGDYDTFTSVNYSNAVRPALHLNLKQVNESLVDSWDKHASDSYAGGSGTETDPYQISNASELSKLAVDSRSSTLSGKYYKLTSNIDLKNHFWNPIGTFSGVFDGNFYTISGMTTLTGDVGGLFSTINGTIKNVYLVDSAAFGKTNVGGIAGYANSGSVIQNCILDNVYVSSIDDSATHSSGGVAGVSYGTISNCIYRNGNIFNDNPGFVGGIVGYGTTITNCSVINSRIKGGKSIDVITSYGSPTITATFGEATVLKSSGGEMVRAIYGSTTAWTGWVYNSSINGGYPMQSAFLTIGSVASDSTAVYNRLKALGF